MNDPIISPWLIWFIGISPNLSNIFPFVIFIGFIVAIGLASNGFEESPTNKKGLQRYVMGWIALMIFSGAITIATPEREWIVASFLANETTPENISLVTNAAGDAYGSVKQEFLEIIQEIQND